MVILKNVSGDSQESPLDPRTRIAPGESTGAAPVSVLADGRVAASVASGRFCVVHVEIVVPDPPVEAVPAVETNQRGRQRPRKG